MSLMAQYNSHVCDVNCDVKVGDITTFISRVFYKIKRVMVTFMPYIDGIHICTLYDVRSCSAMMTRLQQ